MRAMDQPGELQVRGRQSKTGFFSQMVTGGLGEKPCFSLSSREEGVCSRPLKSALARLSTSRLQSQGPCH